MREKASFKRNFKDKNKNKIPSFVLCCYCMCPSLSLMSTTLNSWLCLCCSKSMIIKKALPCILNVVILTLVILMPFAQPSSSSRIYGTNMAGSRPIATNIEVARFGNEAASVRTVEHSARQVPTGPDPLHHNNNPIRP